ncbi:MAG: signal peptidase I [Thermodesulfobacteriota bacterium]
MTSKKTEHKDDAPPVKHGAKVKKAAKETIEAVLIALVLAIIIRMFIIQAFKIPSPSMEDTLLIGDHLFVSKLSYGVQVPKAGIIGWERWTFFGKTVFLTPIIESTMKPLWGEVKRGDVIVFRFPGDRTKDYIKRAIGVPGETIEVKKKRIFINGTAIEDPYGIFKGSTYGDSTGDNFGPYTVPEGHVFVMGDNRDRSFDSRFWGPVPISEIKGRALFIYFSIDAERGGLRFGRIGDVIR